MKTVALILFASLSINIFGVEYEINSVRKENKSVGFYFSFDTKVSRLHAQNAIFSGMRFGVMQNSKYTVGLAGFELSGDNTFNYPVDLSGSHPYKNEIRYGGLFIEYSVLNKYPFELLTPLIVGGGKISIKENVYGSRLKSGNQFREGDYWLPVENSEFMVFEPGLLMDIGLGSWIKLGLGASYRFIVGNSLNTIHNEDHVYSGFSFETNLKIGYFR